ncbi:aspartate carbamoyltransferase, regulatory subunit [Aeropyrum pernix K1]|uniref:Aspartate carbamoyltransferase regulatory chain n=1 Tax=Aeropyrum pernix (strain ATCC 700893 / DSM 11879 / JCM 9820 / NBRC 100138 / K1) TaxID=272557 RepID=PYRI_AERPE|nr:aspartate carbamoyltransferase regulatory subunit [Aeropyrum pernix]Q9YBD5.2 RecName: Full=Aspartate carbamoyltransferase regulatory chain [Aeropyrum pernix K1]BAA80663.2 aspartate carbamoyltransferase, regulatory subunit [Aeropyrum pernix K1]
MEGEGLLVRKIRSGVVIDHIPPGRAFTMLKALGLLPPRGYRWRIAVVINAESSKLGRKDILKIEGYKPRQRDLEVLGIIAPGATFNVIEDYKVVEKVKLKLPEESQGVLRCPNPTCITRKEREKAVSKMVLVSQDPPAYRCVYCGTTVMGDEIHDLISP